MGWQEKMILLENIGKGAHERLALSYKTLWSALFFRGICIKKTVNKPAEQCASKAKIILFESPSMKLNSYVKRHYRKA